MQKDIPTTEAINPASGDLDTRSIAEIIEIMHNADRSALEAVGRAMPEIEKAIEDVVRSFREGGRLFYVGAGTSGRLGVLDASECPPTFSVSPDMVQGIIAGGDRALRTAVEGAEDDGEAGRKTIAEKGVGSKDTVIGISASGLASYVRGALGGAKESGAHVWLLTCNREVLNDPAGMPTLDGVISIDTGPEILTGSTRLKAGTATKLVLNMITTTSMIKIGKVYGNLMVDVRPTNNKLIERARRIISHVTGCGIDEAGRLLEKSGNSPKVAIVMKIKGVEKGIAESLLELYNGSLREVIR